MTNHAWHFLGAARRLRYNDNRLVEVGQTLTVDAAKRPLELCEWGMHWSEDILDALKYAPGLVLCRVHAGGEILRGDDKGCSSERTVIEMHDVTDLICAWTRWCAQQVLHLWDAPEVVVVFLETGDNADAAHADARAADAAYAAAYAADAAYAGAYAARAAYAAAYAAYAAAYAARVAARAARAAYAAAAAADAADAQISMQDKQREKLLELLATRFVCLAEEEE